MNERQICKDLRKNYNKIGWILLLYYGIMNAAVMAVIMVDAAIRTVFMMIDRHGDFSAEMYNEIMVAVSSNAWGYILAVVIGFAALLLWKKPDFCFKQIWKKEQPMTVGTFLSLCVLFFSAQALFQLLAYVMELLFNLVGLSIMDALESASTTDSSFSMFLYACLIAPVWEEIVFRGLVLRALHPYGKKFAILASALLFGVFHGNIVQTPFAFAIGLILGYVTLEHGMIWAVLLHGLNNLVLGDLFGRISKLLPPGVGDTILLIFVWGCVVLSAIVLIIKRKEAKEYISSRKIHPWCLKSFFTSPGILVFSGVLLSNIPLLFLLQILQK